MRSRMVMGALALWSLLPAASGQTVDAQFLQAGYAAPGPVEVAPGQLVTLFFRGIGRMPAGGMRNAQAQTVPLPETLAGISAWIQQLPRTSPYPLALLSVRQHNECEEASGQPVCLLTALRVQIPTELGAAVGKLTVTVDGSPSRTFLIRPVRDDAHVLTTCDLTWDTNPGSDCGRVAFHADGTAISESRPARRGETIVLYAHGLGPTIPRVATGTAAPAGVELVEAAARQLAVRFLALRNADGSLPRYVEALPADGGNAVVYAGLTAGQIGLYQVNVKVPELLEIPILCGGDTRSNAVAKVSSSKGTENVALCVAP
ncbi:MAG: hypothetical protein JNK87_25935 [Bryobacterales bacterium]|nr:hypothetical protein [Bryobacterales bacterium]